MGLESGAVIEDLQSEWPLGGDPTNQGDNHLRLIKNVLKLQFAGAEGNGFAIPITATEEELNWLTGLSGNVQEQFDALGVRVDDLEGVLSAPAGTALLFYQAEAPVGWEQDTSKQDFMVRVISAVGGGSGGADSPVLNDKVPSHTHPVSVSVSPASLEGTLTLSIPGINTGGFDAATGVFNLTEGGNRGVDSATEISTGYKTLNINAEHGHTGTGSASDNPDASDWRPQYINTIIAVKT